MQSVFNTTQPIQRYAKFQLGAPLPKAKFFASQPLHLVNQDNQIVNARMNALQLWPDESIKWVKCEGVFPDVMHADQSLYITSSTFPIEPKRNNWVIEKNKLLNISTRVGDVVVDLDNFYSLTLNKKVNTTLNIDFIDKKTSLASLDTEFEVVYDSQQQPLCCHITQTIDVVIENITFAKLKGDLCVYYTDGNVTSKLSVQNTQAIIAQGGKWDLGNENSLFLGSFALTFNYNGSAQAISLDHAHEKVPYDYVRLVQYSSGGENWLSENHKNRHNKVELLHQGAKGNITFNDRDSEIASLRPQPFLCVDLDQDILSIQPQHFWQKYPVGVRSSSTRTVIDFADIESGCEVELQPGEIKSHSIAFCVGEACTESQFQLNQNVSLQIDNVQRSQAIPFINESLLGHPLQKVLCGGASATKYSDKWLEKREALDEFGWRNFGDLFADHEAAHYTGNGIFVSHYNNQYDPLLGFLKLWLLTGNSEYKTLADELFDHIVNIDIYHTTFDKPEYNKGLFWHTDHYVPAETASHRTYSRHQESDVYMDHAGGGGPGSHHCYSTGIALYYLLTGNHMAKQSTLGLCEWMQNIYEGDGTLLGLVIRAKNANHLKFPFSNKLLLGAGTGVLRNVFTNQYPLDRGTGNNLNVLLDCFELTQQKAYLRQVEFVILNTISSNDKISERHFENIEDTWYYTVFLQGVVKYLYIMSQITNTNVNNTPNERHLKIIRTIGTAYIHYANWMSENETYYLANKSVLEYPNDTWTGQDLRKIHILLCAYELTENKAMLIKAKEISDFVYPCLSNSAEKDYTRIQALIMQNYADQASISGIFDGIKSIVNGVTKENETLITKGYLARIFSFIAKYSIKREFTLLGIRIPALKKVFNK